MVRCEKVETVGEKILGSVREAVLGFSRDDAGVEQVGQIAVEGDFSEANDDADSRQGFDFTGQMGGTVADFLGLGFVAGRGRSERRNRSRRGEV